MEDIHQFVLLNKNIIKKFFWQIYLSVFVFNPVSDVTRQLFKDKEPEWITLKPTVEKKWNSCLQALEGHSGFVNSVAFSPDSQRIVSRSEDRMVKVWDATTESLLQTLNSYLGSIISAAFFLDGQKIVSRSEDKTIKVWNATMRLLLQTLDSHSDFINSMVFSPDGQKIVSGFEDKTVNMWNTTTRSLLQTLDGHLGYV